MNPEPTLEHYIRGQKVVAVKFVLDYLMIGFDDYNLITYNWPYVIYNESILRRDSEGYKDKLCRIIGSHVKGAVEVPQEYFSIEFDCHMSIRVSLLDADREAPDAAVLNNKNAVAIIVW